MKNKKMTVVLIVSVVAVWGIIIYRIFQVSGGESSLGIPMVAKESSYESLGEYRMKDTFSLSLNYRDPFSGKQMKITSVSSPLPEAEKPTMSTANFSPPEPEVNWSGIRYTGYIVNSEIKRGIALLNIHGKEFMLAEGQEAAGVKIIKNNRDSVMVSYSGKTRFLKVQ